MTPRDFRLLVPLLALSLGVMAGPALAQDLDPSAPAEEPRCPANTAFSIGGETFGPGDANLVEAQFDDLGRPVVVMEFSDQGHSRFAALQEGKVGQTLPICLGDTVLSNPRLAEPIPGASLSITTLLPYVQTSDLAKRIGRQLVSTDKPRVAKTPVAPVETDPLALDIAAAAECRLKPDELLTLLTLRSNDPSYAEKRGWAQAEGENFLFPHQYRLPLKISVFGHDTDLLAFTDETVFAVLADSDIKALAAKLSIKPDVDASGDFTGARVITDAVETDPADGARSRVMTALQLTNLGSKPGETLVGCSYVMKDAQ